MRKIILMLFLFTKLVNNITAQSWSPLGAGIGAGYYHSVHAFATYNGELYAGGYFTSAGGVPANNIAKWNGTNWSAVGNGTGGTVYSLAVYNGELYAGTGNNIIRWNGTNWSAAGSVNCYGIKSMVVYNGDLYAAGNFPDLGGQYGTSIVKWNGNTWTPVVPENDLYTVSIECMAVYNGNLYAAGAYYQIGGGGVAEFYRITSWNGTGWSDLLTIPAYYTLDGALGDILSMAVYNGELYISGSFTSIDNITTSQIAKWNGSHWSAVGTGINAGSTPIGGDSDGSTYTFVKSLTVYNGSLYAGGSFSSADTIPTVNIAKWDGNAWSGLGLGVYGYVYALVPSDTSLYVGGWFTSVNGNNIPANKIAKWNVSCAIAPEPGSINGNPILCANSSATYTVNAALGATSYTWSLPPGWTGNSTTNSITITAGTNGGTISVTANNACGVSNARSLTIDLGQVVPGNVGRINGDSVVCENSLQIYSIEPVQGATNYIWTLPPGWTGSSITNTITTTAGSIGGAISVIANNDCGSSNASAMSIIVDPLPSRPDTIYGNDDVCQGSSLTYIVEHVPGATSYTWHLPSGWPGSSITNSIETIAGINNGNISVIANNSCGSSTPATITIVSRSVPATPALINGNDTVCKGSSQTYFIDPVPGATDYAWDLTFGWASNSGIDSVTVVVDHLSYSGDFISVAAYNNCGYSDYYILPVVVDALSPFPKSVSGNTIVCRGSTQTYLLYGVYGPTSYTWTLPNGWVGSSNSSSINVIAGNEHGEILVTANNSCGSGAFTSGLIRVDTSPSKPGDITGNVYVNAGQSHSYSIDPINSAAGYNWSVSGGGNIITGQNTSKIDVNWQTPGTYVLSANAANSCGAGADQTITVKVSAPNIEDPYSLQLYPNPSPGQFFLKAKRVQDKVINVEVLNMAGQFVFRSGKKQGTNDYTQPINLDKMAVGLYAVKIMIDDKTYVRSVMINH